MPENNPFIRQAEAAEAGMVFFDEEYRFWMPVFGKSFPDAAPYNLRVSYDPETSIVNLNVFKDHGSTAVVVSRLMTIRGWEVVRSLYGRESKSPQYAARVLAGQQVCTAFGYVKFAGHRRSQDAAKNVVRSAGKFIRSPQVSTWTLNDDSGLYPTPRPPETLITLLEQLLEFLQWAYKPCEDCGFRDCNGVHSICANCTATHRSVDTTYAEVTTLSNAGGEIHRYNEVMKLCQNCSPDPAGNIELLEGVTLVGLCNTCGIQYYTTENYPDSFEDEWIEVNGTLVCPMDAQLYTKMECCGTWHYSSSRNEPLVIPEGDGCEYCLDPPNYWVNEWDYTPVLNFHPWKPSNPKKPLYIGMELEMTFPKQVNTNYLYYWAESLDSDLLYVKYDSSVENGFEVVTHPMEPAWAMENFPFKEFQSLKDNYGVLETHYDAGTHIHVNKEAFSTSHLWKFLQIHHRVPEFMKLAGGRDSVSMASFEKPAYTVQREQMKEIARKKGVTASTFDRYVAVNLRNEYTIELRYMRSGPWPDEIKKNIQWAWALYDFSDYVTVEDVRNGVIDDQGYFLWWIMQQDYLPDLQNWLSERVVFPKPIKRSN